MEELRDLSVLNHARHAHNNLRENLFRSMIIIIKNLGKKAFRPYVE